MKNLSFLTLLILFIMSTNLRGQWEILNEGIGEVIPLDFVEAITLDFVNENVGWIVTDPLLKTEDGGDTWIQIPIEGNWYFKMIDFVNDSIGWAIADEHEDGHRSVILKTSNSGQTWHPKYTYTYYSGRFKALYAIDSNIVYVTFNEKIFDIYKILQTLDGGLHWTDISPPEGDMYYNDVYFVNREIGIVRYFDEGVGKSGFLRTFDGGTTWHRGTDDHFFRFSDLQFINDSTGYFIAQDDDWEPYSFNITKDTCRTWTKISENITCYYALSNNTIIAIMDDSASINIMKSIDGGYTWEKKETIITSTLKPSNCKIYLNNNGIGFLSVGYPENDIFKSIDMGKNWTQKIITLPFQDVYFLNRTKGFACSGRMIPHGHFGFLKFGVLFVSDDLGTTWQRSIMSGFFISIFFINTFHGFMIDSKGIIYKTDNSGIEWDIVYESQGDSSGYGFWGNDISFINEEIGWVVGTWAAVGPFRPVMGAEIIGTIDGGKNWNSVWNYPNTEEYSYSLNSIHITSNTGWAVGESGMIVKYTEQDQWQLQPSITDLPLNKVFFSDENHGWIAGGYFDDDNVHLKLFKTIDGGENWQEIPDFNYQINDMFFGDSLHGWAVGNDTSYNGYWREPSDCGIILETWDGGNNWAVQVDGLSAPLNALHFKDDYGWAVGDNGLVLRTDGTSWVDQNTGKTYPNKCSLSQNYPNPFNPKTIINYELEMMNHVDLSIYNLLGQKVVSLVSKKQPAGIYQVEWDAGGFASGVYYYQLRTKAGFIQTKKLVLLR